MPPGKAVPSRRAGAAAIAAAAGVALLALALARVLSGFEPTLEPGAAGLSRLLAGAPHGRVVGQAVLRLPGLDRRPPRSLVLHGASADGTAATLVAAIDGGAPQPLRLGPSSPALLVLPAALAPGARVSFRSPDGPVALSRIEIQPAARALGWPELAAAALTLLAGLVGARIGGPRLALCLGLAALAPSVLIATSALALAALPQSLPAFAGPALSLVAAALLAGSSRRRPVAHAAGIAALLALGLWARLFFLPSTGSWDTDYWKAWMLRSVDRGLARAYGDPAPLDFGRLGSELRGEEPIFQPEFEGRRFVIDQPPLNLSLLAGAHRAIAWLDPPLARLEALNVAVKLPPVLADVATLAALVLVLRRTPLRAAWIGALYWGLPVSWLSSAVQGFFDAAVTPLVLFGLALAGAGRSVRGGAALALAALVKPTALIVAPAALAALRALRRPLAPWFLAVGAVLAVSGLPFLLAGTLGQAFVHVARLFLQERLSGGFPNPWWMIGHALTWSESPLEAVRFARIELLALPARLIGTLLVLATIAHVWRRQREKRGAEAACLAGAVLFFAYGILAVGVHENHPHVLYALLFATGLRRPALRAIATAASLVYVLNMLMLSGLGRFHGLRYLAVEPLLPLVASLRMGLGFDATLLLAAANTALFAVLLLVLPAELEALSREQERESPSPEHVALSEPGADGG
jgi:hypothetical protein